MPYQFLTDALPVVPMIVHDTTKVYVLKEGFSWEKILAAGVGLVAVWVAVKGWKRNQILSRENQVKAFEESIKDKIRLELNTSLNAYREWLDKVARAIYSVQRSIERTITEPDFVTEGPVTFRDVYDQIHPELTNFIGIANNGSDMDWVSRYRDYDLFFPQMKGIVIAMRIKHGNLLGLLQQNGHEPDPELEPSIEIFKIEAQLQELRILRNQFFQFFQYECLRTIQGIPLPSFNATDNYCTINRREDGSYELVQPRVKRPQPKKS
jgi:hypothetical protein